MRNIMRNIIQLFHHTVFNQQGTLVGYVKKRRCSLMVQHVEGLVSFSSLRAGVEWADCWEYL